MFLINYPKPTRVNTEQTVLDVELLVKGPVHQMTLAWALSFLTICEYFSIPTLQVR